LQKARKGNNKDSMITLTYLCALAACICLVALWLLVLIGIVRGIIFYTRYLRATKKRVGFSRSVYARMTPRDLKSVAAANGGVLRIVRHDEASGEWVEETITADMPESEIISDS
jgi:hypothetical protein